MESNAIEFFLKEFCLKPAFTEEEKLRVYKLRHKVYCEELKYEPDNGIDKIEKDEFDSFSIHCLIEHRQSGVEAGSIRIIVPTAETKNMLLPFESRFDQLFLEDKAELYGFDHENICEISRTSIPSIFRTPKYATISNKNTFTADQVKVFPIIRLGLFLSVVVMAEFKNRMHGYAVMEDAMPRMLKSAGFRFYKISKDIEFRGKRSVYYNNRSETIASLPASALPIYYHLRDVFGLEYR